ncbi:MAG: hypothetical protein ABJE95_10635 [Byssovorax sp.]
MLEGGRESTRARTCGALGLGVALLLLGSSAQAQAPGTATIAAPAPGASPDADQLYEEGRSAAKAGQQEKARELYQRSWRIRQHWLVAGNLGRIELTMSKFRDAAEHLTYFLKEAPATVDEPARKAAQGLLDTARAKVGELRVTVNVPGAEVLVDGQGVGTAPLSGVVFVNPGMVFVEARLAGYEAAKVSRTAVAGAEETVALRLLKPAIALNNSEPTVQTILAPNKSIVATGIALSSATAAAGIGFAIASPFHTEHKGDLISFASVSFWSFASTALIGGATLIYTLRTTPAKAKTGSFSNVAVTYQGTWVAARISW